MFESLTRQVRRRQKTAGRLNRYFSRRRKAQFQPSCLRAELLPQGKRAFLPQLDSVFNGLELYFHPLKKRWCVYRVAAKGSSPASDFLVMEYELKGEAGEFRAPGAWLIDELRSRSVTRNGSLDGGRARSDYIDTLFAEVDQAGIDKRRSFREMNHEIAKDMALGFVGHASEMVGDEVPMARARAGTKIIWGKEGQKIHY